MNKKLKLKGVGINIMLIEKYIVSSEFITLENPDDVGYFKKGNVVEKYYCNNFSYQKGLVYDQVLWEMFEMDTSLLEEKAYFYTNFFSSKLKCSQVFSEFSHNIPDLKEESLFDKDVRLVGTVAKGVITFLWENNQFSSVSIRHY